MTFARPDALWLLPLAPLVAVVAWWLWRRQLKAMAAWASVGIWSRLAIRFSRHRLALAILAIGVAILGTSLAMARPRWGSVEEVVERKGVDVVFILDSSLSMHARDVAPSRLELGKALIRHLLKALPGHRMALVQTEGKGIVLSPLTVDAAVIDLLLDTVYPGSLPDPGTKLESSLVEALELFPPEGEKHRVVIVVSDGEDHGSDWEEALARLVDAGAVVHALGIGTRSGSPIQVGEQAEALYKRDSQGNVVVTRLEPSTLQEMTRTSQGVFLEIDSPAIRLDPLVEAIASMERRTLGGEVLDIAAERFQWPLALAASALALLLAFPPIVSTAERSGGTTR